tara:strand:+ start:531 stop:1538 length:1008 start_codon:yes stop_codon:yes gene_type:complete
MKLEDLELIDKQKMFTTYDNWPEIASQAFEERFTKFDVKDVDHIVFAGMGGSGSIGDTISAILSKKNIHVSTVKGYLLPKTVDSNSLVIATSVSGCTYETLEILKAVKKTEAKIIGFASGGIMEKYCQNNNIFFQNIPMTHSPRASFTKFLFSILNILDSVLPIKEQDIKESISSLFNTKKNIFSGNLTKENKALEIAEFTKGIIAVYYPAGLRAAAIRYKNCLQENAKVHSMVEDIIESSHNGIVSWERPSDVKPVLIQGKDDHEKTLERWKILEEFFEMKQIKFMKINSIDGNILSKIINLNYLLDYSSIYTAILDKIDPSPVSSIDYFKSRL